MILGLAGSIGAVVAITELLQRDIRPNPRKRWLKNISPSELELIDGEELKEDSLDKDKSEQYWVCQIVYRSGGYDYGLGDVFSPPNWLRIQPSTAV